jgi:hypothetical protein
MVSVVVTRAVLVTLTVLVDVTVLVLDDSIAGAMTKPIEISIPATIMEAAMINLFPPLRKDGEPTTWLTYRQGTDEASFHLVAILPIPWPPNSSFFRPL